MKMMYQGACTFFILMDVRASRESVQQCMGFSTPLPKLCIIKSVDLAQNKGEIWETAHFHFNWQVSFGGIELLFTF